MFRIPLVVAAVAICATGPLAAQNAKQLDLELYLEWERVRDPQISPDGSQLVYSRSRVDKVNDRWDSDLWIINADGSKNRYLTEGSNARWSPDGTRIAFTRGEEDEGSQIFVRWMDAEGATSQVTHVDKTPSSLAWSPDGDWLSFVATVPTKDEWRVTLPSKPEGAKWTAEPKVVTRLNYRRDRIGYIDDGYRHIFLVPATGGTPRQLTDGDWNHSAPSWTPDGSEILFSSLRVPDAEHEWRQSEIYAANVESSAIRQLTTRSGPDGNPVVSPNGQLVVYTGYDWVDQTYMTSKIYVMNVDGGNSRMISTGFDRRPSGLRWAPDNSGVYFTSQDRGNVNVHFASVDGGVRQVTEGTHQVSLNSMNDALTAAGIMGSTHAPGDVVLYDLRNPSFQKLTDVNADVLAGVQLGEVEELWYGSVDDLQIQGWVVKPPDFDPSKKYPLMLAIHGGPHGMYGVGFNFGWQNHAANGYVVLYTNPRGSSGYGTSFGNEINRAYPGKDFDDLMAGVDTIVGRGYVDEDNMFVYGCSGGGVLTSWVVGHTNRFAAASANCPVTNWMSFVGTTDGSSWYRNFDNLPWEDPSEHLRRSSIMYVGNVTTPTMLMTGENDLRTPMPQTEEYYQALRYLKVPTAMIRFKDEWHGTSRKPSNFLRTQLYLREWFEKHKGGQRAVSEP